MRYRHHKYTWTKPFMSVRHDWSFVAPRGALNFWVSITEGYGTNAGIEFHHTETANYRPQDAPDHLNCPLTGGRCWHDGGSLYAMETLWPIVEPMLRSGDHGTIFSVLEGEADRHFAKYCGEHSPLPAPPGEHSPIPDVGEANG